MPNGISCTYQLDELILNLRAVSFNFICCLKFTLYANSAEPDQALGLNGVSNSMCEYNN